MFKGDKMSKTKTFIERTFDQEVLLDNIGREYVISQGTDIQIISYNETIAIIKVGDLPQFKTRIENIC